MVFLKVPGAEPPHIRTCIQHVRMHARHASLPCLHGWTAVTHVNPWRASLLACFSVPPYAATPHTSCLIASCVCILTCVRAMRACSRACMCETHVHACACAWTVWMRVSRQAGGKPQTCELSVPRCPNSLRHCRVVHWTVAAGLRSHGERMRKPRAMYAYQRRNPAATDMTEQRPGLTRQRQRRTSLSQVRFPRTRVQQLGKRPC